MAFTVEDGTGVVGANSYVSVAYADAYFADRGTVAWAGSNTDKQSALIRATDYVEERFGDRWIGSAFTTTQGLGWPRCGTSFAINVVPDKLQRAVSEYAMRALTTTLAPDPIVDETGLVVQKKDEKVGPIEESTTYMSSGQGSTYNPWPPYPAADSLLKGLLKYANGGLIRS